MTITFKVGDRVRISVPHFYYHNSIGKIVKIDGNNNFQIEILPKSCYKGYKIWFCRNQFKKLEDITWL